MIPFPSAARANGDASRFPRTSDTSSKGQFTGQSCAARCHLIGCSSVTANKYAESVANAEQINKNLPNPVITGYLDFSFELITGSIPPFIQ
jgi:hypothetical protein